MKYRTTMFVLIVSVFLSACEKQPSEATVPGRWYTPTQVQAGKALYASHCAACHGEQAQGLTANWRKRLPDGSYPPPPLNGSAHAWHHPMSALVSTIQNGGAPLGGKMPAFKYKLNNDEQRAVIAYFQSFWSDSIYQQWLRQGGVKK